MTRRKDGLWQEVVKLKGMDKPKYFYGKTKAEVLRKINEFTEKHEHGVTFRFAADKWWAEHEPTIAYNSVKNYKPAKNRAVEAFGDRYIEEILPVEINKYIKDFSRTRADKTVRTQLMIFNLVFCFAVGEGYVKSNPVRDLEVPSGLPKTKRTPPSPKDIQRAKDSTGCTFGMFAYWAMYTGMRRGELLALRWDDVDIAKRTIDVTKSLYHKNNRPYLKCPKTEKSRAPLPLLDTLLEKIKPSKGLVFPNNNGEHMTETQFQRQWELYAAESGITATPHQFRHAYATMLYEADIPPEQMQVLLRHAQLSTTMDVYREIRERKVKQIHNRVYSVDIV